MRMVLYVAILRFWYMVGGGFLERSLCLQPWRTKQLGTFGVGGCSCRRPGCAFYVSETLQPYVTWRGSRA